MNVNGLYFPFIRFIIVEIVKLSFKNKTSEKVGSHVERNCNVISLASQP